MRNIDRALTSLIISIPVGKFHKLFKSREIVQSKVETPFIVRLDGVKFGKRLKNFTMPRDRRVHESLVLAAERIIEYMGADLGYVTSDEINILFLKYSPYSSRFFKIISISSGIASSVVTQALGVELFFDSRIVKILDIHEAYKYILYRIRVGFNNYVSSIYHMYYKNRHKGYTPHIHDMICILPKLVGRRIERWELFGTLIYRESYVKQCRDLISGRQITVERRRFSTYEVDIEIVMRLIELLKTFSTS
ncbi:MAG: hypothetical protein GXO10_06525 [Crenarchaeota archaeon]|nr:hypothetical protein [Thermoproteota archaeon]